MMRHILRDLEWGIAFVVITLVLFLIIALLTIQPVIATVTETDIAPGKMHCRSEQVLTDDAGHKWEVMFFTEVDSPEITSLNLRISGLSSSVNIESQKPLIISSSNKRYEAADLFLENPPLASIGQYNLKNILPRFSSEELTIEIPLESSDPVHLQIPVELVEEWQAVSSRNYSFPMPMPKLPYTFEFVC